MSTGFVTVTRLRNLASVDGMLLPSTRRLRSFLSLAKKCAGYDSWDIGLRISSNIAIRRLNKRYRAIDAPTDILSFSCYTLSQPEQWPAGLEQDDRNLGDMIISAEYVSAWCVKHCTDVNDRYERLIAHGLTHLLGYDHTNAVDHATMQAREDDILCAARAAVAGATQEPPGLA